MGCHVLSAGNGYTYLTRQVAAHHAAGIEVGGLGAYYAERGEAPGRWVGSGLASLGMAVGDGVSEAQMVALFGEGRHPNTAAITAGMQSESAEVISAATLLGTPFRLNPAANAFTRMVASMAAQWNVSEGHLAGAVVPAYMMSRIRTAVGASMFADNHGREAADAQELSGFIATRSRVASRTVAGYDLTFSPVKSVSTLWAVAPIEMAREIEAAHHAAVASALGWLEQNAAFTRLGRNGVRQVDVVGLVAAAFTHRDSRAGDPDLHTHVAVSNKVQTLDGRWRALDGRVVFKAAVAASEHYNTHLEAELHARLGVRFADRDAPATRRAVGYAPRHAANAAPQLADFPAALTPSGKRAVREIVGVDPRLLALWSSRRADIDERRAELAAQFHAEHGRPPTPVEAIGLAQTATLHTRQGKHWPRSEAQQRTQWRRKAVDTIGEPALNAMTHALTQATGTRTPGPSGVVDDAVVDLLARRSIEIVEAGRASWQRWHLIAEAQRQLRPYGLAPDAIDAAVGRVVAAALGDHSISIGATGDPLHPLTPPELRRSDGASVYTVAGSQLYTSATILAAERVVLATATVHDGAVVTDTAIGLAVLEAAANGVTLTAAQSDMVRELATSGARVQLALAAAGTGKTTALRVLASAWGEGGGETIGLAPSAAAAAVLRDALNTPTETIAKFLHDLAAGGGVAAGMGRATLLVIDEAAMAATADLARIVMAATTAGASVRLIGDDQQLAAIGAGGVLRDIAEEIGAVSLSEALRFSDPVEADATLALRRGEQAALGFYLDRRRVLVGDEHTAPAGAYAAWAADRAAGLDSLLLAPTRERVTALNVQARADRLAASRSPITAEVTLGDGTVASAGDLILTTRNDRRLRITATDWVKNGDRFTITTVQCNGALDVTHHDTRRRLTLPASYVAQNVMLGYAATIHTAQGRTADTAHVVIDGHENRQQLYVALTRGRHANYLHLALPGAADEHAPIRRDTLLPPTAIDLLTAVIHRDGSARSATTELREHTNPARQLQHAVAAYTDAVAQFPTSRVDRRTHATEPPLRWLPPMPMMTSADPWRQYLTARAEQIRQLARDIAQHATRQTNSAHLVAIRRRDPSLLADLAVWTAIQGDHVQETSLTVTESRHHHQLQARLLRVQGSTTNPLLAVAGRPLRPTPSHGHEIYHEHDREIGYRGIEL